jgi:hypothetical protein
MTTINGRFVTTKGPQRSSRGELNPAREETLVARALHGFTQEYTPRAVAMTTPSQIRVASGIAAKPFPDLLVS